MLSRCDRSTLVVRGWAGLPNRILVALDGRTTNTVRVDVAGARHQEPGLGNLGLDCVNEVASALEIDFPDLVFVGRAEQGGQMDDRVDAVERSGERCRVEDVALVVCMLASPRSGYVTAANHRVDGGQVRSVN